ncbi:MAG: cytochrome c [Pirellulales bacterium]
MLALWASLAIAGLLVGPIDAAGPPRRARPPKFSNSIRDAFFPNAREKLVGPRPAPATPEPLAATPADTKSPTPSAASRGWSKWIAAEVVEDEIKTQQIKLAEMVQNPTRFKGGDYQQARGNLSVLAVMFAIAAEYDGHIRWQRDAAAVRDLVSRAGFNCKVGTDGSYNEAKSRSEDLQTLVRGGSIQLSEAAADAAWSKVADRAPLMKRLERAQQQSIAPLTANAREFERHADTLAHEAQMIAALAEVITREGFEFADDETYLEYARAMQAQALSVRDAAKEKNYEQARQAAGELGKACSNCHEKYRS